MLLQHFQRFNKLQSPPKQTEENKLAGKGLKGSKLEASVKEEQKQQKHDSKSPKLSFEEPKGSDYDSDCGGKNLIEHEEGNLTPRLINPVTIMRKERHEEDEDEIPCERYGPVRALPLLINARTIYRPKCRLNRSQLLSNSRSTYGVYVPSLGSHE